VDSLRIGRSLRVIRRSRGQRQLDIAHAAGVSQTLVSKVERGRCDHLAIGTVGRIFAALEADIDLVVRYRGGTLDRLLDERHAATVASVARMLQSHGWTTAVEVTFNTTVSADRSTCSPSTRSRARPSSSRPRRRSPQPRR
jgi:transcriptional regulator with XRE-family HTH domain